MNLKKLFNNNLEEQFQKVSKAEEFQPLPVGKYEVRAVGGELVENINATEFYRVRFEVVTGPYAGRHVHHQIWLTENSLAYAKRDLEILGIYSLDELDGWEPDNTVFKVVLITNKSVSGVVFNKVFSVSRKDTVRGENKSELNNSTVSQSNKISRHKKVVSDKQNTKNVKNNLESNNSVPASYEDGNSELDDIDREIRDGHYNF